MRPIISTLWASLALVSCARADMRVCKPMPSAEEGSAARWQAAADSPEIRAATKKAESKNPENPLGSMQPEMNAKDGVLTACIRRNAYQLAQGNADTRETADAALQRCADVVSIAIREAASVDVAAGDLHLPSDTTTSLYTRLNGEASALVVEARAGRCWAQ